MEFKNKNVITILTFVLIMLTSFAYSSLATNLAITGEAMFRTPADVRVSNITFNEATGGASIAYEPKFTKNTITTGFNLPETTSSISYTVRITNNGLRDQAIYNLITQSSNNAGLNILIDGQPISSTLPIIVPFREYRDITITYTTSTPGRVDVVNSFDFRQVYYITYNTKGGSSVAGQTKYQNVDLTLTSQRPILAGYRFLGWTDEALGERVKFEPGDTYTIDGDNKILYAIYTEGIYEISLDDEDSTTSGTNKIYEKYNTGYYLDASATNQMTTDTNGITIPVKDGYKFGGYYTQTNGQGIKVIGENGKIDSSVLNTQFVDDGTLYAKWTPNKLTINYYANGAQKDGSTTIENQKLRTDTYDYDGTDLSTNGLRNYDSTQGDWNLQKTGYTASKYYHIDSANSNTKVHEDTTFAKIQDLANAMGKLNNLKEDDVEVNVYAGWTPIEYTITYNLDGGSVSQVNPATYTIETNTFTLNNPTKTDYDFTGWTGSNGQTPQQTVTIEKGTTGNKTYTANYELSYRTITFDANGGTGSMSTQQVQPNTPTPINPNTFTKTASSFIGWNTERDGSGDAYLDEEEITLTSNITLYAQWLDKKAIFDTGKTVNEKMKKLSGGSSSTTYSSSNSAITSIQKSSTRPDVGSMTDNNIVSSEDSEFPIYMWFENGTIYWWSEDEIPSLNEDSSYMFSNLRGSNLNLDLSSFDTSNVTNMSYMFYYCNTLTSLDLSSFDTSKVTTMSYMFYYCNTLTSLDLNSFDTSNVTTMYNMFYYCQKLESLDLSSFDTSKVTNMSNMFYYCQKLENLDLSSFDTSKVTTMSYMFYNCRNLTNLNLSNFDTNKVTTMYDMFYNCQNLTRLDLSSFDTSSVTDMGYMFNSCSKLRTIYVSDSFNVSKVSNSSSMFSSCTAIVGQEGTIYNSSKTDKSYAHIDGGTSNPGYLTDISEVKTIFLPGDEVNAKIKKLSGQNDATSSTINTTITAIKSSSTLPFEPTYDNVVSIYESLHPIYMWYDDGIIYYYSNSKDLYLNNDSSNMFANLTNLQTIEVISDFNTSDVTTSTNMFLNDTNLVGGSGTTYSSSHTDVSYAKIDEGMSSPGYFTKETYTIIFNANGGTGTMNNQIMPVKSKQTLNANTFIKEGYAFVGWNRRADGSGDAYLNKEEVKGLASGGESMTLYAQWAVPYAEFDTGQNVNAKMKKLSGSSSAIYETNNTSITSIQKSNVRPDIESMTDDNIVSSPSSLVPIYMWYENGTIYWWSEVSTPSLNADSSYLFSYLSGSNLNIDLSTFDTSNVTSMANMFYYCQNLESLDLSTFDTSKVTTMSSMFSNCSNLVTVDLSNFDTSSVLYMGSMFYNCQNLTELDLSSFDTNKVTSMTSMFYNCSDLVTIYVDDNFVVSQVTSSSSMFDINTKLVGGMGTTYNLSHIDKAYAHIDGGTSNPGYFTEKINNAIFDTGENVNVKMKKLSGQSSANYSTSNTTITSIQKSETKPDINMMTTDNIVSSSISSVPIYMWFDNGTIYWWSEDETPNLNSNSSSMFYQLTNINNIDLSNFNTSNVIYMQQMFGNCTNLTSLDLSNFDTSKVTNMTAMFTGLKNLTTLDLSNFDTSKVTNMSGMFSGSTSLITIDLSSFDTSKVTNMDAMFPGCSNLTTLDLSSFDTSNVTNMSAMFADCTSLTTLDLSNFNTSKVTNIGGMFSGCSNLTILFLDGWDLTLLSTQSSVLGGCSSLKYISCKNWKIPTNFTNWIFRYWSAPSIEVIDVSNWNLSATKDINGLFGSGTYLKTIIGLETWDTSKITDMRYMFQGSTGLTSLDLSSFDTSSVTHMTSMFEGASNLTTIYASDKFQVSQVTNSTSMFNGTSSIVGGAGTVYDSSYIDKTYAHIDGGVSNPGYFTNGNLSKSTFISGSEVNTIMKQLSGQDGATSATTNTSITAVKYSETKPNNLTNNNIVSTDDSVYPIYMWYTDGVIYYNCSQNPYLNEDSSNMFANLTNLQTIEVVADFNTSDVTTSTNMFLNDTSLVGGSGTTYSSSHTDVTYARIDEGTTTPGYFTSETYTIIFNANGGTGEMSNQVMLVKASVSIKPNTYSKDGYMFIGWNTESDGSGDAYLDQEEVKGLVSNGESITLYAQWVVPYAEFDTGQNVNAKMKKLSGSSSATYSTNNTSITSIQKSSTRPDVGSITDNNIVSSSSSLIPIYMWFDSGTIYWWSEDSTPSLNANSSYLFNNLRGSNLNIDLSSFDTSNVTNMSNMFSNCLNLITLDLSNFDTSKVTTMQEMFNYCQNLTSLDLSSFDTSKVTTMYNMFYYCQKLASLDLSSFNTSNVTTMYGMFNYCQNLTSLDLSSFNTSNVTTMYYMFNYCQKLESLDLSNFDTSKVTTMYDMFYYCQELTNLNISSFDTRSVTNMQGMFTYCKKIKEIDVSSFDTSNTTNIAYMFQYCTELTTIYASEKFTVSHNPGDSSMFSSSTKLVGGMGTVYNSSYTGRTRAHIDGGSSNPGYFTKSSELKSIFLTGSEVNAKMKLLSGQEGATPATTNTSITAVYYSKTKPSNLTDDNIVSTSDSYYPIYMWYDDGIIYYNCSTNNIYLNSDSSNMFSGLSNLTTIEVEKSFNTDDVETSSNMFLGDTNLIGGSGTTYSSSNIDVTYARIDEGTTTPGYFTSETYTIIFSSNSGTGEMSNQVMPANASVPIKPNTYTKEGYAFIGWNTKVDGTGDAYLDQEEVKGLKQNGETIRLYAQWVVPYAEFDTGKNVNVKMKKLSGQSSPSQTTTNTTITSIQKSNVAPSKEMIGADGIVSSPRSLVPIYMWFENGTIYWWSLDETPSFNADSSYMFSYLQGSNLSLNLSSFDTSNVTTMEYMFYYCQNLQNIDLSSFDVGKVTTMFDMFYYCQNLETITFGEFDSSNVTNMGSMFGYCNSLTSLDLSMFNTSKVINMTYMFYNCSNLESLNISNFDFSSITNSSNAAMFYQNSKLETITADNIILNSATYYNLFKLSNLRTLSLKNMDVTSLTSINGMFCGMQNLETLYLNNAKTGNIRDMGSLFDSSTHLQNINLSGFNTSEAINMMYMFQYCSSLTNLDLSSFDTSKVTNMSYMFDGCTNLININLSSFNTSNVGTMEYMLNNCSSLTNLNLSSFNTSNVGTMSSMFNNCSSLTSLNLSSFNTGNVGNMFQMFNGCSSLTSIDLSSFNTSKVTNMNNMFSGCSSLTSLDLSSFDTRKVTGMSYMFSNCTNLETIYVDSKYNVSIVSSSTNMFSGDTNLVGGEGTVYDSSKIDKSYAHIDEGVSNPGYFTGEAGRAIFLSGSEVNIKMKELSGQEGATTSTLNTNITAIRYSENKPNNLTDDNIVSTGDSYYPIYMWYDNGTIYYNCNTNNIYLNSNSSNMFANLTNLQTIEVATNFNFDNVTSSANMFSGDTSLVGGSGTTYSSSHTDVNYAKIDEGISSPGYFTQETYTIVFNSNEGTGTMSNQVMPVKSKQTLKPNTFTNEGYAFIGWNTEADGSGDAYLNKEEVKGLAANGESITLYAQWIIPNATFDTGQNVNSKMKYLTGQRSSSYSSVDTMITSIQKSSVKPDIESMTDDNIVSSPSSLVPIYMWFDSGTIYWWSEDSTPSLNANSSYLFNNLRGSNLNIDLSSFDTSNVTNMSYMFQNCTNLTSLEIRTFNTSKVTTMSYMFNNCTNLRLLNISTFNTSNVTNMSYMFNGCTKFYTLNLTNFNTEKVTNMSYMFSGCSTLASLDISTFKTSAVTNMSYMFSECSSLSSLSFNNNFNTSKVTNMSYMFSGCSNLATLNVSKFNTTAATNMSYMFNGCSSLDTLDLGSFATNKVTNTTSMFQDCSDLTTIYVTEDFVVSSVTSSTNMFLNDTNLVGGTGTTYDSTHIDKLYARIDDIEETPGYFTGNVSITYHSNVTPDTTSVQDVSKNARVNLNANTFTNPPMAFRYWTTNADGTGDMYYDEQRVKVTTNMVLYAQWKTAGVYAITFRANGGTGTMSDQNIQQGSSAQIKTSTFTNTGKMLVGWNTKADGTGDAYLDDEIITPDKDLILYAQWFTGNSKVVTLNANNGIFSDNKSNRKIYRYKENTLVTKYSHTQNISDTGLKSSNYGNRWNNYYIRGTDRTSSSSQAHVITIPGAESLTVDLYYNGQSATSDWASVWAGNYPNYTAQSYRTSTGYVTTAMGAPDNNNRFGGSWSGTYTVNGNTLTNMGHTTLTIPGDTVTFSFYSNSSGYGQGYGYYAIVKYEKNIDESYGIYEQPTRSGYEFVGWNSSSDGSGTSYTQSQLEDPSTDLSAYAQWGHKVIFNGNGNTSGSMSDQMILDNVSTSLSSNTYTKTGCRFLGWNTKSDGSGTSYTNEQAVTLTSNLTLYAQWGHKITFNGNGNTSGSMSDQIVLDNVATPLSNRSYYKTDNAFIGWNTEADGSGTTYTNGQVVTLTSDLTLYAQWYEMWAIDLNYDNTETQIPCDNAQCALDYISALLEDRLVTITYNANGGTGTMQPQNDFKPGDKLSKNTFTQSGYRFIGWNTKADGTGNAYLDEEEVVMLGDTTLYAQWLDTSYTSVVTYNANGGEFTGSIKKKQIGYKVIETPDQQITKYSHTQNLDDTGTPTSEDFGQGAGKYSNSWTNANITGTDRGSLGQAHVVTIPDAETLHVSITYSGEGCCDWVAMWEGSHPEYTAASNYSTSITDRLYSSARTTKEYDITGDTVTFAYKSDGSAVGDGYGYYAVVTGVGTTTTVQPSKTYEQPTREDHTFEGWFIDKDYSMPYYLDANNIPTPIPTTDRQVYAKWSSNTVPICRRASTLHTETCNQNSTSNYCGAVEGYNQPIVYGKYGTNSTTLTTGDAFDCDVNGDGNYNQRFYYVSDYFDTDTQQTNSNYATLIYYSNVTNGTASTSNVAYASNDTNYNGPVTAVLQLPTKTQWSNINLYKTNRQILAQNNTTSTSGGSLPVFDYSDYAARLLTYQEVEKGCKTGTTAITNTGGLNNCNFLMEESKYAKSSPATNGPWLETPNSSGANFAYIASGDYRFVSNQSTNAATNYGVRPTIDVFKNSLDLTVQSYLVKFDGNASDVLNTYSTVAVGDSISTFASLTRTGYVFLGWYTDKTGGTQVTAPYTPTSSTTLYAHWRSVKDTEIRYDNTNTGIDCTTVKCVIDKLGELYY